MEEQYTPTNKQVPTEIEDELNSTKKSNQYSTLTKVSFIVALLFFIVLLALIVFGLFLQKDVTPLVDSTQDSSVDSFVDAPVDPFAELKGEIHLTLAEGNDSAADLYVLDVKSRSISRFFEDSFVKYTGSFSPDGEKLAYAAAPLDRSSESFYPFTSFLQIHVRDIDNQTSNKLTESRAGTKRLPAWSPDGKQIAFAAQAPGASQDNFFVPNEWEVSVTDLSGNTDRIDSGTSPFWSPDGKKLLYLKSDGLYTYSFETEESTKVWEVIEGALTNMKLDVSDDGTLLAWSDPNLSKLMIFNITSWDSFELNFLDDIGEEGYETFWPVFSPDGRYLVYQEIEIRDNRLINPQIKVFDLFTNQRAKLFDLGSYNFDVAFIDDWRY